jgi:hypothetical protein
VTQVIAVDWSGRAKGAAEAIWLARVDDGQLVELENGRERKEVVAAVIERARGDLRGERLGDGNRGLARHEAALRGVAAEL